jgi:hypothetical protein
MYRYIEYGPYWSQTQSGRRTIGELGRRRWLARAWVKTDSWFRQVPEHWPLFACPGRFDRFYCFATARSDRTTLRAGRSLHAKRRGRGEPVVATPSSRATIRHGRRARIYPAPSLHSSIEHASLPVDFRYLRIDCPFRAVTNVYGILYMSDVPLSESGREIRGKPRSGAGRSGWDC